MTTDLAQAVAVGIALSLATVAAIVVPQAAVQQHVPRTLGDELSDAEKAEQLREVSKSLEALQDKADLVEERVEKGK